MKNKKLKIGFVTKYFYPFKGGAEMNSLYLAIQAAKDGHEVHIFTSNKKKGKKTKKLEENYKGVHIHRSRTWFNFSLYFAFYPGLICKLLKTDLDIVHVSGIGFIWHDLVLMLKRIHSPRSKFVNTPHGPFMALDRYNIFLKLIKSLFTSIQKIYLNWLYDKFIQVNTFQWQWIMSYGIDKRKIEFVPNGIPSDQIQRTITKKEKVSFAKKYNLDGKFVISTLGRISKYKGIQHVIKTLPELIKIDSRLTYLIMGRDEGYLRKLKVLAEKLKVRDHVVFIENVLEQDKYIGLALSEIFIFPSEWEALGIVMIEAMAQNNALISSKTEGGKYIIKEGINGFLYEYGKVNELTNLISRLMSNKDLRMKFARENKKLVKKFSWERIYQDHFRNILKNLAAEKR